MKFRLRSILILMTILASFCARQAHRKKMQQRLEIRIASFRNLGADVDVVAERLQKRIEQLPAAKLALESKGLPPRELGMRSTTGEAMWVGDEIYFQQKYHYGWQREDGSPENIQFSIRSELDQLSDKPHAVAVKYTHGPYTREIVDWFTKEIRAKQADTKIVVEKR